MLARPIGRPYSEVVESDDPADPGVVAQRRAVAGETSSYIRVMDGRSFEVRVDPMRDEEGATAQKRAEHELRQSEAFYRSLFENLSDCIFIVDVTPDQRFKLVSFNPAEERAVAIWRPVTTSPFAVWQLF